MQGWIFGVACVGARSDILLDAHGGKVGGNAQDQARMQEIESHHRVPSGPADVPVML